MTARVLATAAAMIGFLGLCLLAEGPFSVDWSAATTFDPNRALVSGVESTAELSYETGPVLWTSYSNVQLTVGYLWQEFGACGHLGAFSVQADVLLGPSTGDFLYAQAIAELRLAGLDMGFYYASVSHAVFGGPADGLVLRVAASFAGLDVVSITEMGARIEDDDFDGIDIVYASTGSHRHYATDPIVPRRGFTGQKLSVSGLDLGSVGNAKAILYLTYAGFDFVSFELEDVATGIPWLDFDLEVTYHVQTKIAALTPHVTVADGLVCVVPYFAIDFGATAWEIDGFELGGLAIASTWDGVTLRNLTVSIPHDS